MSDPTPRLPARPSLEQLRKQAKELLRAFPASVVDAIQRFRAIDQRFADPDPTATERLTLSHAQFVIAREHGFESWPLLVHHLRSVGLMGTPTGDGAIAALAGKDKLRSLRAGYLVTEAGLAALHRIPKFRRWRGGEPNLSLMGGEADSTFLLLPQRPFAEQGLGALAGLDGVFALHLFTKGQSGGRAMTGRGVEPLAAMPNLGWLSCKPGDDALEPIAALPRLRMLSCQDTDAGDDAFVALSRSRSLEYLTGGGTRNLTGRGFVALSAMPTLRGLAVRLDHVDDAGLSALPRFPALREPMGLCASHGCRRRGAGEAATFAKGHARGAAWRDTGQPARIPRARPGAPWLVTRLDSRSTGPSSILIE
jgi:hypothetical protein